MGLFGDLLNGIGQLFGFGSKASNPNYSADGMIGNIPSNLNDKSSGAGPGGPPGSSGLGSGNTVSNIDNQSALTLNDLKALQQANNDYAYKIAQETWARSEAEANRAREFESLEAQKNRDYQTEMSNTAYQRAVADMRKAGINPMMAFSNGGASTPAGSAASGSTASHISPQVDNDTVTSIAKELISAQTARNVALGNNITNGLGTIANVVGKIASTLIVGKYGVTKASIPKTTFSYTTRLK